MINKYEFDESKHCHTLNGVPLYGVTTVLSVISKPALIQWSANMACDWIRTNCGKEYASTDFYQVTEEELKEASVAHRKKKEVAGSWGTEVHQGIENYLKGKGDPVFTQDKQQTVFDKLKDPTQTKILEEIRNLFEDDVEVESEETWIEITTEEFIGGELFNKILDLIFETEGVVDSYSSCFTTTFVKEEEE